MGGDGKTELLGATVVHTRSNGSAAAVMPNDRGDRGDSGSNDMDHSPLFA